jgi:hypothetical protein
MASPNVMDHLWLIHNEYGYPFNPISVQAVVGPLYESFYFSLSKRTYILLFFVATNSFQKVSENHGNQMPGFLRRFDYRLPYAKEAPDRWYEPRQERKQRYETPRRSHGEDPSGPDG